MFGVREFGKMVKTVKEAIYAKFPKLQRSDNETIFISDFESLIDYKANELRTELVDIADGLRDFIGIGSYELVECAKTFHLISEIDLGDEFWLESDAISDALLDLDEYAVLPPGYAKKHGITSVLVLVLNRTDDSNYSIEED